MKRAGEPGRIDIQIIGAAGETGEGRQLGIVIEIVVFVLQRGCGLFPVWFRGPPRVDEGIGVAAPGQAIEIIVEILGQVPQVRLAGCLLLGEPVEPGEQGNGEAGVVIMIFADDDAVVVAHADAAGDGARLQLGGDARAGAVDQQRVPHAGEGEPLPPAAEGIGRGGGEADGAGGVIDDSGGGEMLEEARDRLRRPAVVARLAVAEREGVVEDFVEGVGEEQGIGASGGVGFPKHCVFPFDQTLFDSLSAAWERGDRAALVALWEAATPLEIDAREAA